MPAMSLSTDPRIIFSDKPIVIQTRQSNSQCSTDGLTTPYATGKFNFHREHSGRLPTKPPFAFLSRFPDPATVKTLIIQQDRGLLERTIFAPLPPMQYLLPFMKVVMEDINKLYPLFTTESRLTMLLQQQAPGPGDCQGNPSRWATLNALLAMAIQWKSASNGFEEMSAMSWTYFKNAFSVFPELNTQGTEIETCEALLAMAMFMHGSANARATSHLIGVTARSLQVIGLCRRERHRFEDPIVLEQYKRVFWITHVLSSDAMMKYGLPSAFDVDAVNVELPSEGPTDSLGGFTSTGEPGHINIFRYGAELSVIQLRICRRLCQNIALRQSSTEILGTVAELDRELETWKSRLPELIRPSYDSMPFTTMLDTSVTQLHFSYYNAVGRIHMATAALNHHGAPKSLQSQDVNNGRERLKVLHSSMTRAAAARASLVLLQNMPPQPLAFIW